MTYTKPQAFTLIELLVVVTIIVVLLALLTPALDRAIASAESAVCMVNLRNWSMAMKQYTMDHKGHSPYSATDPQNYWFSDLAPYMGEPDFATRTPTLWVKANICPLTKITLDAGIPSPIYGLFGHYWGSAHKVWQWGNPNAFGGTVGSYGMNMWNAPHNTQSESQGRLENYWGRYVNTPGEAPLVGDANWMASWPVDTDLPPPDTENGNASSNLDAWAVYGQMGSWVINRHPLSHMAINLSFVGGDVQNVRLGGLWDLQWHKNFVRTDAYEDEYP